MDYIIEVREIGTEVWVIYSSELQNKEDAERIKERIETNDSGIEVRIMIQGEEV